MCARATILNMLHTNTHPSVECTCRESRPIRLALCRTVHFQSELVGEGNFQEEGETVFDKDVRLEIYF